MVLLEVRSLARHGQADLRVQEFNDGMPRAAQVGDLCCGLASDHDKRAGSM